MTSLLKKVKILYIGSNKDFSSDFGLKIDFIKSFTHKENAFLANNFLNESNNLPNVILFDTNFSNDNVSNFYNTLKSNSKFNKIVYIIVCNSISEKQKIEFLKEGIDEIIFKPFKINDYSERIKFLINYKKIANIHKSSNQNIIAYKTPLSKRIFDVILSSILIIITSPIVLAAILAIKIESKGPFYYAAKRVGSGYKIFDFYKLRSMYVGADEKLNSLEKNNQYNETNKNIILLDECQKCKTLNSNCSPILIIDGKKICEEHHFYLKKNKGNSVFKKFAKDPRVTKVGRFIRNTSIDELPQLINVLKGDMSIVGNRPLPKYEAEQLTSDNWAERFKAPSGITGLWQVEKRGASKMSEDERKELDNLYARKPCFLSDIKLIFRTFLVLVQRENV
jgi:lipopolysaccharide/colanic/teichoic acid biosynthesis glycosyltransferase